MPRSSKVIIDTWIYNPAAEDSEDAPETLEVTVKANYTPGYPAKISGPPEHCYPEEPAEVELLSIRGDEGFVLDPSELSDRERERLEQDVIDWVESQVYEEY
jgi:hypothetical protein